MKPIKLLCCTVLYQEKHKSLLAIKPSDINRWCIIKTIHSFTIATMADIMFHFNTQRILLLFKVTTQMNGKKLTIKIREDVILIYHGKKYTKAVRK